MHGTVDHEIHTEKRNRGFRRASAYYSERRKAGVSRRQFEVLCYTQVDGWVAEAMDGWMDGWIG